MSKSGRVDGGRPVAPQQSLNQTEAQKSAETKSRKLTAADQARLVSQAGFQKMGAHKKRRGFDVGDGSQAPIPLPSDDIDPDEWSAETLEEAQTNMAMASAQFAEVAKSGADLAESAVGSSFLPTESDVARMQLLADREPPPPLEMEDVNTDVSRFFNIDFGDSVPTGQRVLATGLVVAGEAASVKVDEDGVDEKELSAGLQKVAEKGNQAVGQAQRMNKGVNREVNFNRTFVFKR